MCSPHSIGAGIILDAWRERLHQYTTSLIQAKGHKMIIINSMRDHIHLLVGMRPHQAPSDLMNKVKRETTVWVNDNKLSPGRFAWQDGFGVFAVERDNLGGLITYIKNQQVHHRKQTFEDEYLFFLRQAGIEFDERFVFDRRR